MEASYFNVGLVRWEPLVESWTPVITAAMVTDVTGRQTVRVGLTCEQVRITDE